MYYTKKIAGNIKRVMVLPVVLSGILLGTLVVGQATADTANSYQVSKDTVTKKLDPYFQALADNNRLLGRVALYQGDKQLFGTTLEADNDRTNTSDARLKYKIGSITKTFTATLVFQLIEENKLSLDTTLDTYYPKVANAKQITIKQMLNHHSGIHSYTDDPNFINYHMSPQDKSFLVNKIEGFDADFEPGEKAAYSNSNYLLLGYIIEQIEDKPYAELLQQRIYQPLGMANTFLGKAINPENAEAYSYQFNGGKWQEVPQWDMSVAYSAGALVSTAEDLSIFIRGLFAGKLINTASLEQMTTLDDGFGKGIFGTKYKGKVSELQGYWHNGGIEAFISHLAYYPEEDVTAVVLTNGMNYDIRKIYETMLDAYFGKDVPVPEFGLEVELEKEVLESLVGDYESATHPLDITVSLLDKQLFAQATGQGGFPLTALDQNTFEYAKAGIEMRFDRDNEQFELKQGGRADVFAKTGVTEDVKVDVPAEVLQQYVGTYAADDFPLDIEIMVKEGQLFGQATGQSAFPLTPVTNSKFKFDLANIVIEFDVEKSELTITQRGHPTKMQKQ